MEPSVALADAGPANRSYAKTTSRSKWFPVEILLQERSNRVKLDEVERQLSIAMGVGGKSWTTLAGSVLTVQLISVLKFNLFIPVDFFATCQSQDPI